MLTVDVGIAKTHKYASRDSGDTVETVERPTGGLSVVIADGQGSGFAAKTLSMMVSSKAVALLKDGIRDGAVARGVHDSLLAYRHGKVSATLDLLSVDLASRTVLLTRNSHVPYIVVDSDGAVLRQSETTPIGVYRHTRPTVHQHPISAGLYVVVFTDGVSNAGRRAGCPLEPLEALTMGGSASDIAEGLLAAAIDADQGRPGDDMAVVALAINAAEDVQPIRTMRVTWPIPE
ncbi:MAG TPA: stage II sporulation protein E [Chloroflexi bacterium]|nr:stage II sporulation protein E [Chloroflexota bacterium]